MQRQSHSHRTKQSAKKRPAPKKARPRSRSPQPGGRASARAAPISVSAAKVALAKRSFLHWHTPEELALLEAGARKRAEEQNRELRAAGFVIERPDGGFEIRDDIAEQLTEEWIISATKGEETHKIYDDEGDEEALGPVIEVSANQEFAEGTDESNPPDAEREALPTAGHWEKRRNQRARPD